MLPSQASQNRGQAYGLLALMFLVGAATGAFGIHLYDKQTAEAAPRYEDWSEAAGQLRRELGLTEQQAREIEPILERCIMDEADLMRRIHMMKQDARTEILAMLDNNQRVKFRDLLDQSGN